MKTSSQDRRITLDTTYSKPKVSKTNIFNFFETFINFTNNIYV